MDENSEITKPDTQASFGFLDPSRPVAHLAGNLPHWRQEGVTYFVTFRLADSIPQVKLRQWLTEKEIWMRKNPEPHSAAESAEFEERFPARFHRWLDSGYGACVLRDKQIAEFLRGVLRHFDGNRYNLREHVVMPNHVHAIVTPLAGSEVSQILHSWKSFSATRINMMLGRKGALWEKESFDHIVRNPRQLEKIEQYIRDNPKSNST